MGEWGIEGYRREFGAKRRYLNVPYCSDLGPFFEIRREVQQNGHCQFLFSGSFIRRKGVDLLASAFTRLLAEGFDARLHLVGAGPLRQFLEGKCGPIRKNVVFHGFKQWDELASVYAEADILCAPSRYDGWGLVVVEGLAAGLPVISTDRTGAARDVLSATNGWLVRAGDEETLYSALKAAVNLTKERYRAMSEQARRSAANHDLTAGIERFLTAARVTRDQWMS
jgi:glycosyltransferase involved in cell wall biosynthesis